MKIKLTTMNKKFIPSVEFEGDNGKMFNNRDNDPADQIVCDVVLAGAGERFEYTAGYSVHNAETKETRSIAEFQYKKCVSEHCVEIKGLEDFSITNGKELCEYTPKMKELDIIERELFNHINGLDAESDDSGE